MKKNILSLVLLVEIFCAPAYLQASAYSEAINLINSGERVNGEAELKKLWESNTSAKEENAFFDLLTMLAEEGRNAEAIALTKDNELFARSFFMQFEIGWNLLSLGKIDEAVKALTKAKAMTASPALISQADFVIALCEARRGKREKALETIASIYTRYPYMLAVSSQLLGKFLMLKKDYAKASYFTGSSLQYDNTNFQAEADFAEISEKQKAYTVAWQAWRTLQEMDPQEKEYAKNIKRLSKKVKGDTERLMFWQSMDWPVHTSLRKVYGGDNVKIGLYSNKKGVYSEILEFSFMSNSDFIIKDDTLGQLMQGKKFTPWKIVYVPSEKMIEIHDSLGSSARSTYGNINIECQDKGAVILIKDPLFADEPMGINRSDREVGGNLLVRHAKKAMRLSTLVDEESLNCSITTSLIRRSIEMEFAKTAAIAARTKIRGIIEEQKNNSGSEICDSSHCLEFNGLQAENALATAAVEATKGQVLISSITSKILDIDWVKACGGLNEACKDKCDKNPLVENSNSPFGINAALLKGPKENLACIPESRLEYTDLNWTLVLEPKWIISRVKRVNKKIGKLKSLVTISRDNKGRVLKLRAIGTKGYVDFEGDEAISNLLSAGSLRSSLFTIRPVMKGKYPLYFVVHGSGTGFANGENVLCLRGAEGLATKESMKYKEILNKFFPNAQLIPSDTEENIVSKGQELESNNTDASSNERLAQVDSSGVLEEKKANTEDKSSASKAKIEAETQDKTELKPAPENK